MRVPLVTAQRAGFDCRLFAHSCNPSGVLGTDHAIDQHERIAQRFGFKMAYRAVEVVLLSTQAGPTSLGRCAD
jgi:hypothetical protein